MGGKIQTCPNCGEYVLPPAVQVVSTDDVPYHFKKVACVMCGWTGFTDELKFKFIPTLLVGEPFSEFVFNTGGSAARNDDPATSLGFASLSTSPPFTPLPHETIVACVHTVSEPPGVASFGGVPMTLISSLQGASLDFVSMFYLPNAPLVSSVVTVFDSIDTSFNMGIVVVRFTNYPNLSQFAESDNPLNTTSFDSGPTATQSAPGHIAISSVVVEFETNPSSILFGDSFSTDISAGSPPVGPSLPNICLAAGHRIIGGTSAVRSTGTYSTPSPSVAMVAVFKP